jgi:hypothetical protein
VAAVSLRAGRRHLHALAVVERPNLIALNALRLHAAHGLVVEPHAREARQGEVPQDRDLEDASETDDSVDAVSLDHQVEDLATFFKSEFVHGLQSTMLLLTDASHKSYSRSS